MGVVKGYGVRLLDGPEAGETIVFKSDDGPGEEIVVFRCQLAAPGVLVCSHLNDDGTCGADRHPLYTGDHVYRRVTESELPPDPHPNVLRGGGYEFVRTVEEVTVS